MLNYEFRYDDGILVLKPDGPLAAADFSTLVSHVDAYLNRHGTLRGVMIQAREFPGWKDFGALVAHLRFVRLYHRRIEKVAVVSDGSFATLIPDIADHFVHAKVKHYNPAHADAAWDWLIARGRAWIRKGA
ncbi:MAG: STAS/SEC14 domain-containing protein [Betaproteobacteria bacterium]|nr:STAS/SEC14 domain-containing protein [Betaproteobacteria bacterium]